MRLLQGLGLRGRVLERVVLAEEVDAVLLPEPVHDLELLREHRDARRRVGEREAVRTVLALHPACAEPELYAPAFVSGNAKPYARCSRSIQPVPSPSSMRPPAMWSTVATAFASSPGSRNVAGETSVPKRSVVVRAASPASVVHASCATFVVSALCEM